MLYHDMLYHDMFHNVILLLHNDMCYYMICIICTTCFCFMNILYHISYLSLTMFLVNMRNMLHPAVDR